MATKNMLDSGLSNSTGTGTFSGSTSATYVAPVLGAASATSLTFSSTDGVIGSSTNDNANTGSVGEYVSSIIASPGSSISNNTNTDITSISLTAGDWDVWGNVGFTGNNATQITFVGGWTASSSATRPDPSLYADLSYKSTDAVVPYGQGSINFLVPKKRYSLASTTTIYLSVLSLFTVSTTTCYGAIYARRVR